MTQMQHKSYSHLVTLRIAWRYVRRYPLAFIGALFLSAVTTLTTLYVPRLIGHGVDCALAPGQVQFQALGVILCQIGICVFIISLGQFLATLCNNRLAYCVTRDVRNDAFDKLTNLPLSTIDARPYGEFVSCLVADAEQFADGLLMGFTQLFSGITAIVGVFIFMLRANVTITLVVVALTPISLLAASFISRRTYRLFQRQSQTRAEQTGYTQETMQGRRVTQAFNYQQEAIKRFEELDAELTESSLYAIFYSSITNPATRFVNSLVYAGVGLFGALAAINGTLTVGQLVMFLSYADQYAKPFNEISGVATELQNAFACAARLFALIESQPEPEEPSDAVVLREPQGRVELQKVDFSYDKERPLIENLNVCAQPGTIVAIVGPTGCGKTTLINLLMRFYDVDAGVASFDEIDIRQLTRESLRDAYGMVLQETWLKNGTIRENIEFGSKSLSQEELDRIARLCQIDDFIASLPQGYDTVISENGLEFSEGQRQLLCVARVMASAPTALILDEATSSIDTRAEIKIQNAFTELMQGRTCFIVAHRLSTIRNAQTILVMNQGRIIEQGNHQELLAKRGFYYRLYMSQFVNI
ncbi:MAG: ABC transporter ATP-binding protein [Planctomycetia bacterium]|nr:ABC transporter ATP-binding protein [Planctomycetia bacterium]